MSSLEHQLWRQEMSHPRGYHGNARALEDVIRTTPSTLAHGQLERGVTFNPRSNVSGETLII